MCKSLPLTCNTVHHILKKEGFLLSELTVSHEKPHPTDQRRRPPKALRGNDRRP